LLFLINILIIVGKQTRYRKFAGDLFFSQIEVKHCGYSSCRKNFFFCEIYPDNLWGILFKMTMYCVQDVMWHKRNWDIKKLPVYLKKCVNFIVLLSI